MNNNTKRYALDAYRDRKNNAHSYPAQIPTGGQSHGTAGFRTREISHVTRPVARVGKRGKVGNCKAGRE